MTATDRQHYVALDSLRGICALAVVLFHFRTEGMLSNLSFIRNGWMFVDFFFVLSGFVISAAYAGRFVGGGVTIGRFMGLRLGRIYPLHLAVLLAMVAIELLLVIFDFSGVTSRAPFEGGRSIGALGSNLALLHSFGLHDVLTWNGPSWSIAAEMWMYLLFAILFDRCGTKAWWMLGAIGLTAVLWLAFYSANWLNTTNTLGFVRCAYGFAVGCGVFWLVSQGRAWRGSLAEFITVGIAILFVVLVSTGPLTLLAPLIFALPVMVFAGEAGALSRCLAAKPLLWLGTISYSTYMVHAMVQARIGDAIKLFGEGVGLKLESTSYSADFPSEVISGSQISLDILTILMTLLVIGVASLTYLWIEKPCRALSRALVARMEARSSTQ